MATPANPFYTEEFVLPDDKTDPTVFSIGTLDTLLRVHIDDEHTTLERIRAGVKMTDSELHHKYLEFVRFGLHGWKNFKDAAGKEIEFKMEPVEVPKVGVRQAVTIACLNCLTPIDMMLIGMRISKLNTLTKADRKN